MLGCRVLVKDTEGNLSSKTEYLEGKTMKESKTTKQELASVRQQIREKAFQIGHGDYRNLVELNDVSAVLDGLATQLQKRCEECVDVPRAIYPYAKFPCELGEGCPRITIKELVEALK